MGIIHATIIIEEIAPARQLYYLSAQAPSPAAAPIPTPPPPPTTALVMMAQTAAPKKKILGLRYTGTGTVVPLLDAKGAYVDADTKVMVWIPAMNVWIAGPGCGPK